MIPKNKKEYLTKFQQKCLIYVNDDEYNKLGDVIGERLIEPLDQTLGYTNKISFSADINLGKNRIFIEDIEIEYVAWGKPELSLHIDNLWINNLEQKSGIHAKINFINFFDNVNKFDIELHRVSLRLYNLFNRPSKLKKLLQSIDFSKEFDLAKSILEYITKEIKQPEKIYTYYTSDLEQHTISQEELDIVNYNSKRKLEIIGDWVYAKVPTINFEFEYTGVFNPFYDSSDYYPVDPKSFYGLTDKQLVFFNSLKKQDWEPEVIDAIRKKYNL